MTRLYGVIGDPIAQSLSPLIHNGWMRDHNIGAEYRGLLVARGELRSALETLAHRGVRGLNVTMPHKHEALALSDDVTPRARAIGAANTLWRPGDGTWSADNTDAPGFIAALSPLLDAPLMGRRVLVLGAGGAARAIVYALCENGAGVVVANRTQSKAEDMASDFQGHDILVMALDAALSAADNFDLVINTTGIGHSGGQLSLAKSTGGLFYDISYGKAADPMLQSAAASGWKTADGLSMLVYQAAFAFERWFQVMPDVNKGLERARRVLEIA